MGMRAALLALLAFGVFCGCSSAGRVGTSDTVAARLGYEGCRLSKPLTIAEIMAKDMSGGIEQARPHPDWDALIAKRAPGDQTYFIDCRKVNRSSISAGTSLYALVRKGVIIARAAQAHEE